MTNTLPIGVYDLIVDVKGLDTAGDPWQLNRGLLTLVPEIHQGVIMSQPDRVTTDEDAGVLTREAFDAFVAEVPRLQVSTRRASRRVGAHWHEGHRAIPGGGDDRARGVAEAMSAS
jgi:hypothetical protein